MRSRALFIILIVVPVLLSIWLAYEVAHATHINQIQPVRIENNEASASSNYEIEFELPTGFDAGLSGELDLTFPAGMDLTAITVADVDIEFNSVDMTLTNAAPAAGEIQFILSGQTMKFSLGSAVTLGNNEMVLVQIGDNAAGGTNKITNPNANGSYFVEIESYQSDFPAGKDEGLFGFTINDGVNVSAEIMTNLTFTVNGVATGVTCPNTGLNAEVTSTATEIAYGQFFGGDRRLACQEIIVTTNATNGYVVTIQQNRDLTSGSSDTINKFAGGSGTADTWLTPEIWLAPAAPHHGYFGFNSNDTSDYPKWLTNKFGAFQSNGTAYPIATQSGPSMTETNYVNYMIEVDDFQASGLYTNVVQYICTGFF